jgi:predicted small lipoprotein YifL
MKQVHITGLLATALALGGCGLKGPLYLPEKSGEVVIRGPASPEPPADAGPTGGTTAPAEAPASPPDPQNPP